CLYLTSFFPCSAHHCDLHSFPTRRSSDLLDLSTVEPSVAGPKRPQDRLPLGDIGKVFQKAATAGSRVPEVATVTPVKADENGIRSEEHTSEHQSRENLVCRHLLEKKKIND